jgi:hypothetical protein
MHDPGKHQSTIDSNCVAFFALQRALRVKASSMAMRLLKPKAALLACLRSSTTRWVRCLYQLGTESQTLLGCQLARVRNQPVLVCFVTSHHVEHAPGGREMPNSHTQV